MSTAAPPPEVAHKETRPAGATTGSLGCHRFQILPDEAAAAPLLKQRYDGRAGALRDVFRPGLPGLTLERALAREVEVISVGEDGQETRRAVEVELWVWE